MGGHVVRTYTVPGHTRDLIFWTNAEATMDAYRQLREDCQVNAFDVLHAIDIDRLGRDPALSNQVVSLVERSGAEVYLASAPHPIGQTSTSQRYIHAIQAVRAKEDQTLRTARVIRGMRNRVTRGLPANHWPIGYIPIRNDEGQTVGAILDPDLAPAVRLITDSYLTGAPYSAIRNVLNDSPYHPPRAASWSAQTIRKMMNNDVYAGFPHWDDSRPTQPSDHYPALWSPDEHQRIINERARRAKPFNHRAKSTGSPFTGVAFCARCKGTMTRHINHGIYALRCSKHNQQSITGKPCHYNYTSEATVSATIANYLQALTDPVAIRHELAINTRPADTQADLDQIAARLDEIDTRRHRLALTLAAGKMDPDIYRRADDELIADKQKLEAAYADLQQTLDTLPDPDHLYEIIQTITPIFPHLVTDAPPTEIRAILQSIGLCVEIENSKIVFCKLT